jgi:uncharacterized protein involved in exopolysaccharide biosynthesis
MDTTAARSLQQSPPRNDTEQLFREFVAALWAGRWPVLAVSAACVLAAAAAAWLVPKKYEASLVLSPVVNQPNEGGLGTLTSAVSQFGGIASLAGLSMSGNSGARAESLATLESEALAQRYIEENKLLRVFFASEWDPSRNAWKSEGSDRTPTLWAGSRYFRRVVRGVKENPKNGLVTLTMTWKDPKLAAEWANGFVRLTNDYLREKAIKESERNIAYLNDQVSKTSVVEVRNSIYSLMEMEIKKGMLARGSEEYALKVIDPAIPPDDPVSPRPILWTLAAFCAGFLFAATFIFIRLVLSGKPPVQNLSSMPS